MTEPSVIRTSDSDRNAITAQLRAHCLAGRIPVEELEHRLGLAIRAETIPELQRLVADLPRSGRGDATPVGRPMSVGRPGVRPFIRQVVAPADPARTRRIALETLAPGLARSGFELLEQSPSGLLFERVTRNGWFSTRRERVVISLEEHGPGRTLMVMHGRAGRAIRRRFAALSF